MSMSVKWHAMIVLYDIYGIFEPRSPEFRIKTSAGHTPTRHGNFRETLGLPSIYWLMMENVQARDPTLGMLSSVPFLFCNWSGKEVLSQCRILCFRNSYDTTFSTPLFTLDCSDQFHEFFSDVTHSREPYKSTLFRVIILNKQANYWVFTPKIKM